MGGADDGEVAEALGETAGGGVVADEVEFDVGVAVVPAALELGGVAAHRGPDVANAQPGVAGGGLVADRGELTDTAWARVAP